MIKHNIIRTFLLLTLAFFAASCDKDDELNIQVRPDYKHIPLNKEDSLAMVAYYHSMKCAEWELETKWDITDYNTWDGCEYKLGEDGEYHIVAINCKLHWILPDGYSLPAELGNMKNLTHFFCNGDERATGGIPKEIFNCPLETFYIYGEGFTGTIPKEIGKVGKTLEYCKIWYTGIGGEIPEEMSQLKKCFFSLNGNRFTGKVPLFFRESPYSVELRSNYFTEMDWRYFTEDKGHIPELSDNCLQGVVPQDVLSSPRWEKWKLRVIYQREGYGLTY